MFYKILSDVRSYVDERATVSSSLALWLFVVASSWVVWRLWRFTIVPILYPEEPKQLPYSIPGLGHTIPFMRCAEALYARGNKHFASHEPYGITIAGGTTVVIRDTADLAAVWKNTTALSYDPFVSRMLTAFGISKANVKKAFQPNPETLVREDKHDVSLLCIDNPRRKCYMHLQSDWFKTQLLPGRHLTGLQERYLHYLDRVLHVEKFHPHFISSSSSQSHGGSAVVTVSLGKFTRAILSHCALRAFFGEALFEVEPDFSLVYQTWEDDSWKVFYNYPNFAAPALHAARLRAIDALARYYSLPQEKRQPCWIFQVMNAELEYLDFSRTDRAGIIMMICWAINNNAHYINFWMLMNMLCQPDLLQRVRAETDACCTNDGSCCDLEKLLATCPTLDAVWNESLRLYNASTAVRKATEDCYIGKKLIRKGYQIFGPVRNWQLEQGFFGPDAGVFNPDRWLKDKDKGQGQGQSLTRSKGFTPFGGGHTYCPGRYFAQRETYMFIALLLHRFELQVTDEHGLPIRNPQVPPVEVNLPAPAAMRPVRDAHVTLRRRVL